MIYMSDPENRARILRPLMMKNGKYLITRISGSGQEADPNKILNAYFRYKNYISGDNDTEKEWLKSSLNDVWSPRFLGLMDGFAKSSLDEIKKLEFQNPSYSGAFRAHGRRGDPRDYNKVFAVQVSGCTYSCNYCYVPPAANAANPSFGKFFSAKEIVDNFLLAKSKSKEPMNVIRLTGGETTIVPEIIADVYSEIEKRGLDIYLWVDTNLSTSVFIERIESDLKDVLCQRNVGVVGCFKGVSKEDFSMITGASQESYERQFKMAKLLLNWKTDLYHYLPSLVYGNGIEEKLQSFLGRLRQLNKNLPLRLEMIVIKEYPGAVISMAEKEKEGRPISKNDQRMVFDLWYNKILPRAYPNTMLNKFCCEVPL